MKEKKPTAVCIPSEHRNRSLDTKWVESTAGHQVRWHINSQSKHTISCRPRDHHHHHRQRLLLRGIRAATTPATTATRESPPATPSKYRSMTQTRTHRVPAATTIPILLEPVGDAARPDVGPLRMRLQGRGDKVSGGVGPGNPGHIAVAGLAPERSENRKKRNGTRAQVSVQQPVLLIVRVLMLAWVGCVRSRNTFSFSPAPLVRAGYMRSR